MKQVPGAGLSVLVARSSAQPCESKHSCLHLLGEEIGFREVTPLARSHPTSKRQNQVLTPRPRALPCTPSRHTLWLTVLLFSQLPRLPRQATVSAASGRQG